MAIQNLHPDNKVFFVSRQRDVLKKYEPQGNFPKSWKDITLPFRLAAFISCVTFGLGFWAGMKAAEEDYRQQRIINSESLWDDPNEAIVITECKNDD